MTLHEYLEHEMEEIRRHKWIESEKAGRDLGQAAVLDWIERYAGLFHERMRPHLHPGGKVAVCAGPDAPRLA